MPTLFLFAVVLSGSVIPQARAEVPPYHTMKACAHAYDVAPPAVTRAELSPFRREILKTAESEIGKVTNAPDPVTGSPKLRTGWDRLLTYWNTDTGEDLTEKRGEKQSQRARRNSLVNPGYFQHTQWCGLFALWSWKTAARTSLDSRAVDTTDEGKSLDSAACFQETQARTCEDAARVANLDAILATRWIVGTGLGRQVPFVRLSSDDATRDRQLALVKPGDIMAFDNGSQHMSIVEAVIGDDLYTIDGNQGCGMTTRRVRKLSETKLVGYFRAE